MMKQIKRQTKKLYTFRLDPDLAAGLKQLKQRDGIPESEQIRRAIKAWLEANRPIEVKYLSRKPRLQKPIRVYARVQESQKRGRYITVPIIGRERGLRLSGDATPSNKRKPK